MAQSHAAPRGAEQRPPTNIKPQDEVQCKFPISMGPGLRTRFCGKRMDIVRYYEIVSPVRLKCSGCQTFISPRSQFVAVCRNARHHTNGGYCVICCRCLEVEQNRDLIIPTTGIDSRQSPNWTINSNCLYRKY